MRTEDFFLFFLSPAALTRCGGGRGGSKTVSSVDVGEGPFVDEFVGAHVVAAGSTDAATVASAKATGDLLRGDDAMLLDFDFFFLGEMREGEDGMERRGDD